MVMQEETEAKILKWRENRSFVLQSPDPMTSATAAGLVSCSLQAPDAGDSACCWLLCQVWCEALCYLVFLSPPAMARV